MATSITRRVLEARKRLQDRGIWPTRLEITDQDFDELFGDESWPVLGVGVNRWIGLDVVLSDATAVAGKPPHRRLQVVCYEREAA